ncbi:coronatine-insensitive protein homolog 1b-like [Phoenix dactylifera]|uniref:Coronatine-insensitive protein homolog 1b-like n=1 Tax=Phoenix dactylifera TaxID=42345 RepID=A0A8B9AN17_PHODC|nr:coronatine-insensitive protein homolog 1b-like [Phoenix dactylifera]XP_038988151.1 coronatine-insensitive protein homolog 1b-like [Phoenix dactylifera]XP_038988152.1 coronatine-insensitive protein homolog 1b-like [Phoenix dactylifera]
MCFAIPDVALDLVMGYIDDPRDREAVSLVCKKWYRMDAITRKHITIAICYSTSPDRLRRRFPRLESLKLKGKPRAAMFNLIPEDWGGYATPWVREIAETFNCLKALHFRRMIVTDADISLLVKARGHMLQTLKLDKCSGFSTDGLLLLARSCRCLKTLFLEESSVGENDGAWLQELAINNSVLETLNFYMTELRISSQDLELLARNCRSLISLKISECDVSDLVGFFRLATALEEFGGGSFNDQAGETSRYESVRFPPRLCCLGLIYMGTNEMQIIFPFAASLKKLDLQYTFLSTEDHCQLIQRCPNLEILEARNVIGDRGLEVVAQTCKKLRRLRIERGDDEQGLEDEQGRVSQVGLSTLAQGCPELEYLAVYVSDITNAALEAVGTYSKNLCDFRLVLLDREERITELPLDNGVRALLRGCTKLRRFAFYLRPGGLSDVGLGFIGECSRNIRWILLGNLGQSDVGLLQFARVCPSLQKLEMRGCCFTERALALAVTQLPSLRYLWVQGYKASPTGRDLMAMARPFWNIEFIPPRQHFVDHDLDDRLGAIESRAQILAYYSLAGKRTDCPDSVVPLYPE